MEKQKWGTKIGFILSAAGSAIGLGAIWKFPYMTGIGGGGAFFLVFILFTLFIGLPILLAEFVIGRSTQKEAVAAYKTIAPGSLWPWVGRMGVAACFLLLSFYSVIGGWILIYLWYAISGKLWSEGLNFEEVFGGAISNPLLAAGAQLIFILLSVLIVSRGVQGGLEKVNKYFMPALFIMFLALIARSLSFDHAIEGVKFFLQPDFGKMTPDVFLYALGQSFFSLSVGVSVMVTYSSYLSKKENITKAAFSITGLTLLIALLAGLAIFPAIFSFGMEPEEGPGLLFIVLPAIFSKIAFGELFFILFLLLFFFAALTSAISMLEINVAAAGKKAGRSKASFLFGLLIFAAGIPSALSFGEWNDILIFGKTFFDLADYLVSNILLPLGALFITIFVPWRMDRNILVDELQAGSGMARRLFALWLLLLKYAVPAAIIIVFLNGTGIIKF
ncbi:sodium-dependent transporter [Bacillus infantis]|jgi:neurotransmitter:Na+ symporter, NSS family|uniref:sodium-dependent transporter n=1 Tax=Bacillus infantis TaxID=324767 RepID=UPI00215572D3|nr:sodium-dependent transporter [Bacillus infantis]MCR6611820.1 sodium-dependent transporter [Bacillus infantis]